MTNPLSFNSDRLVTTLQGLQNFDPPSTGWNISQDGGSAAYFIAGNSEYSLDEPSITTGDFTFTQDVRDAYTSFFNALIDALPTSTLTPAQQTQVTTTVQRWQTVLDGVSSLPSMQIDTVVHHIRSDAEDDHCTLQLTVVWSEELGLTLPVTFGSAYAWGVSTPAILSPGAFSSAYGAYSKASTWVPLLLEGTLNPMGLLVGEVISLAFDLYHKTMDAIANIADDGGRVYFPAVVAQCLVRLTQGINSPTRSAGNQAWMPRASGMGQQWNATWDTSNLLDADYSWFACFLQDPSGHSYNSNLPEVGWTMGGWGTLVSFKLDAVGIGNAYGTAMLVLTHDGTLWACAGALQLSDGIHTIPTMVRGSSSESADSLIDDFMLPMNNLGSSYNGTEQALPGHLASQMKGAIATLDPQDELTSGVSRPPLPSIATYYDGYIDYGYRPAQAMNSAGYAIAFLMNNGNTLYRDVLRDTTGSVALHAQVGGSNNNEYQDGQDPYAATLVDGETIVEVHGGGDNNKLYYNIMTLSGSSVTHSTSSGSHYDNGESPSIAVANAGGTNRIFEVHRDGKATSQQMYYNTATWDGSDLSWDKNGSKREFAQGEYPVIAFAPDHSTLIAAYAVAPINTVIDGGQVVERVVNVITGDTTSNSVSFGPAQNPLKGTTPALAVMANGVVVMFAGLNGRLVYALGHIDEGYITWTVCGKRWGSGNQPNLIPVSGEYVAMLYEAPDAQGNKLNGASLGYTSPPGFVLP